MPTSAPRPIDANPTPTGRARRDHAAAARDRTDHTVGGLSGLLARRPDLRGVHPPDWLDDAVPWSA
jgi:hypothetical protein